jgi:flagellar hook-associated protein 2
MVTPKFSFSGIASGLDTDSMVKAIMDAERIPQSRLKVKKAEYDVKEAAWGVITTKMSAIRTALDSIKAQTSWDAFATATSSDDAVVTASTTGAAAGQSTTFTVDQLAATHQRASTPFGSSSSVVGAGTFTITRAGTAHDFTTGSSTTLEQLASQINADSTVGVTASVVNVAAGDTRLVLSAKASGEANVFTATGTQTGLAATTVNREGQDAILMMGDLEIHRSSNTVTDLVKGVTINLKAESTTPVTVTTGRDADKAVKAVTDLVTAVNDALTQLKTFTKYDAESKEAGDLQNDSSARGIAGKLTGALSGMVQGLTSGIQSVTGIGLSIQRDGTYKLDEAKFRKAFNDDFQGVASLFARSGQVTDTRMSFVIAGAKTQTGAHAVTVTQAATAPGATGSAYSIPGADETIRVTIGARNIDVVIAAGDTLEAAISKINTTLTDNNVFDISASADSGALRLASSSFGSGSVFSVSGASAFGLDGAYQGTDVAGTIDGVAARGSGQTLTALSGTAEGLVVRVTANPGEVAAAGGTLSLGSMTYSQGAAGQVLSFLGTLTDNNGTIQLATRRYENQEKLVDERIAAFDVRLALREATLRRQFTAMETALSTLQSQQSYLGSALSSLPTG